MLGKIEGNKRRGWQDEMVGWHDKLNGHESEHGPGVGDGQGGLLCCGPWGCKEPDTTERLTRTISSRAMMPAREISPVGFIFSCLLCKLEMQSESI